MYRTQLLLSNIVPPLPLQSAAVGAGPPGKLVRLWRGSGELLGAWANRIMLGRCLFFHRSNRMWLSFVDFRFS